VLKITPEQFFKPAELKSRLIEKFDKDMESIHRRDDFNPKALYMCFVGDPFTNNRMDIQGMTTLLMGRARREGLELITLTKGAYEVSEIRYIPIIPDWYGVSCVSLDESFRKVHEPGTVKFDKRLKCAGEMSELGSKTWASVEPYPVPKIHIQEVKPILEALRDIAKVSKIIFGKWNYDSRALGPKNDAYYVKVAKEVVAFCNDNGIFVKVKDDILNVTNEDDRKELTR
jgi:DNA repair photolyase